MTSTRDHATHESTHEATRHRPARLDAVGATGAGGHVIEVEGLHRRYGGPKGFEAVRGVDLSVRRGELFALLGTNGAGKTSTLEVLEGLAPATSGTVRVLGVDPYRRRDVVRPRTGVMLQDGGFAADLTVAETVRMWAGTLSRPRPVAEAIEWAGMTHRSAVPARQLSGGERRRLELAVAILGRPEVLFLDEPTTGLDPESRQDAWQVLRDLLAGGVTVVLTTHYLTEAESLADRLAIMHGGRVVRRGTVAEVAAAEPARVTFGLGDGAPPPGLPGTTTAAGPGRWTVRTPDLQATLTDLLAWAARHDVTLHGLDARSASLEEAFLAVAGRAGEPHPHTPTRPEEVAA